MNAQRRKNKQARSLLPGLLAGVRRDASLVRPEDASFRLVLSAVCATLTLVFMVSCAPVKVNGGQVIRELPAQPMPVEHLPSEQLDMEKPAEATKPELAEVPQPASSPQDEAGVPVEPEKASPVEEKEPIPAPPRLVKVLVLPDSSRVDARMGIYAEKLKNWQTLEEQIISLGLGDRLPDSWSACKNDISEIFSGYSRLMELVQQQSAPSEEIDSVDFDLWGVYYQDMAFLEGDCGRVFKDGASLVKGGLDRFSSQAQLEAEDAVDRYAEGGHYEEAILAYNNLLSSNPGTVMRANTRRAYAIALLKTGRLSEAVDALQDTISQLPATSEKRSLQRLVADLLLSLGRADEATKVYQELADFYDSRKGDDVWVKDQLAVIGRADLKSGAYTMYQDVLRHYLSFDGRNVPEGMENSVRQLEEQFPASPFAARARENLREVLEAARGWFDGQMAEIDRLVDAGKFDQARAVADGLLTRKLSAATREMAQHTREEIDRAEKSELEKQQQLLLQTRETQWQEAEKLYDQRFYDQAIKIYKNLYDTEYDQKAREKVVKASDRVAAQLRRKAANLFVKARRSSGDLEQKRQYFVESWKLLERIITDYPESTLLDKVKQNQAILAEQIKAFDPNLFETLTSPPPDDAAGGGDADPASPLQNLS